MIGAPGPLELLVILGIALLVLGPKRLPDAARSAGKALRELRDALSGGDDDDDKDDDEFGDSDDDVDLAHDSDEPDEPVLGEAEHQEAVAGAAGEGEQHEPVIGEAEHRESVAGEDAPARKRGAGTEAGDPAPPPVS